MTDNVAGLFISPEFYSRLSKVMRFAESWMSAHDGAVGTSEIFSPTSVVVQVTGLPEITGSEEEGYDVSDVTNLIYPANFRHYDKPDWVDEVKCYAKDINDYVLEVGRSYHGVIWTEHKEYALVLVSEGLPDAVYPTVTSTTSSTTTTTTTTRCWSYVDHVSCVTDTGGNKVIQFIKKSVAYGGISGGPFVPLAFYNTDNCTLAEGGGPWYMERCDCCEGPTTTTTTSTSTTTTTTTSSTTTTTTTTPAPTTTTTTTTTTTPAPTTTTTTTTTTPGPTTTSTTTTTTTPAPTTTTTTTTAAPTTTTTTSSTTTTTTTTPEFIDCCPPHAGGAQVSRFLLLTFTGAIETTLLVTYNDAISVSSGLPSWLGTKFYNGHVLLAQWCCVPIVGWAVRLWCDPDGSEDYTTGAGAAGFSGGPRSGETAIGDTCMVGGVVCDCAPISMPAPPCCTILGSLTVTATEL